MWDDFTSQDDEIYKLLTSYNVVGMAFYIILYVPENSEGLILPLLTRNDNIVKSISSVVF